MNNAVWSPYWDFGVISALKKKGCKIGLLMLDPIIVMNAERKERMLSVAKVADIVYTYDVDDSKKFGWHYTNCYYSKTTNFCKNGDKTNVFCVMRNSGRLEKAVAVYDVLTKMGQKCLFYIYGVSEEEQKQYKRLGIVYNQYLSYGDILNRIYNTNILLEIGKDIQKGNSLRIFEAIIYNKKLLTTCEGTRGNHYFSEELVRIFNTPDDIISIPDDFFDDTVVDYKYMEGDFSPIKLYREMEKM